jgi:DNA-binding NtrC family response regulator
VSEGGTDRAGTAADKRASGLRAKQMTGQSQTANIILVVEDDHIDRQIIKEILVQDGGYEVLLVASAEKALQVLESRSGIRLLITDVRMSSGMDGFTLARHAAERWPELRILAVSGHDYRSLADLPGRAQFLYKAFLPARLLGLVQRLLNDMPAGRTNLQRSARSRDGERLSA